MVRAAVMVLATLVASPALAAPRGPVLDRIEGQVIEAPGTRAEIARRGATCIAKFVRAGVTTAPVISSQDFEGGVVTAQSTFLVGSIAVRTIRSTITLEAKDGRFRITVSEMQQLVGDDPKTNVFYTKPQYIPIYAGWGQGADKVEAVAVALNAKIAACVQAVADDNW